tara:strand:- start:4048 stop:4896 length:849 start_codon:yes stop_codon:yes gene_type:complete
MKVPPLLSLAALICSSSVLPAATLGYYRFESGAFQDNSQGTGSGLLNLGSTPTQLAIPASGTGSAFPTTIEQTGASNGSLASLFGSDRFAVSDASSINITSDFTIEAFIDRKATTSTTQYIASNWYTSGNYRSFALGVAGTTGVGGGSAGALFLLLSDGGSDVSIFQTGLTIGLDTDYYVGVSFDQSDQTSGITFYTQDLTSGGALLQSSIGHDIDHLNVGSGALQIGAYDGNKSNFQGLVDEVRISNTALSESELLVIPEPSAFALVLSGSAFLCIARRRR